MYSKLLLFSFKSSYTDTCQMSKKKKKRKKTLKFSAFDLPIAMPNRLPTIVLIIFHNQNLVISHQKILKYSVLDINRSTFIE